MCDQDTMIFAEVRYRKSADYGSALESINAGKQRRLVFSANHYLSKSHALKATHFDVLAITQNQSPEWIIDGFVEDNG